MFPTKEELQAKKLEKLKPEVAALIDACVAELESHGAPARVSCGKYSTLVRQQVINEARQSDWDVTSDYDTKIGEDFLVIHERLEPVVLRQKLFGFLEI